jgi:RNA polymerase sigma-70 factor (ECF subfamily)
MQPRIATRWRTAGKTFLKILVGRAPDSRPSCIWWIGGSTMTWPVENARDYLRLVARLLWQPGVQRPLDLSDAVQQTLLKAHANGHQFRGSTEQEWRGWLRQILLNELRQAARDKPAEVSLDQSASRWEGVLAADQSSPSERLLRHEQMDRLAAALGQLLDDERTAVELKHLHGCSVEYISEHLGRSKEAVAGLLKRGLRKLRQLLPEVASQEKG